MKCVKKETEIKKVDDSVAVIMVKDGWKYCPKSEFKKLNVKTKKEVKKAKTVKEVKAPKTDKKADEEAIDKVMKSEFSKKDYDERRNQRKRSK